MCDISYLTKATLFYEKMYKGSEFICGHRGSEDMDKT